MNEISNKNKNKNHLTPSQNEYVEYEKKIGGINTNNFSEKVLEQVANKYAHQAISIPVLLGGLAIFKFENKFTARTENALLFISRIKGPEKDVLNFYNMNGDDITELIFNINSDNSLDGLKAIPVSLEILYAELINIMNDSNNQSHYFSPFPQTNLKNLGGK